MTEREITIAHEAGHASAALCLGLPVHLVTRQPGPRSMGHVEIPIEDLTEDREAARKGAIMALCGAAMADESVPAWPLRPRMRGDDVHLLSLFCERLELDEKGYEALVGEMWDLTFTRRFTRLYIALSTWLERVPRMDLPMIVEAQTLAWLPEAEAVPA